MKSRKYSYNEKSQTDKKYETIKSIKTKSEVEENKNSMLSMIKLAKKHKSWANDLQLAKHHSVTPCKYIQK